MAKTSKTMLKKNCKELLSQLRRNKSDWHPRRCRFDLWSRSVGQRSSIAVSCGIGQKNGSDPTLLWLRHRPAATAPIQPLDWEPPYATEKGTQKNSFTELSLTHSQGTWVFLSMQSSSLFRYPLTVLVHFCLEISIHVLSPSTSSFPRMRSMSSPSLYILQVPAFCLAYNITNI